MTGRGRARDRDLERRSGAVEGAARMLVEDEEDVAAEVRGLRLHLLLAGLAVEIRRDPREVDAVVDGGAVVRHADALRPGVARGAAEDEGRRERSREQERRCRPSHFGLPIASITASARSTSA